MPNMESKIIISSSEDSSDEDIIINTFQESSSSHEDMSMESNNRKIKVSNNSTYNLNDKEVVSIDTPLKNRELLIKGRRGVLRKLLDADAARIESGRQHKQLKAFNEDNALSSSDHLPITNIIVKDSSSNITTTTPESSPKLILNEEIKEKEEDIMKKIPIYDKILNNDKPKMAKNIFEEEEKVKEEERIEKEIAMKHQNTIRINTNISKESDNLENDKNNLTIMTTPKSTGTQSTTESSGNILSGIGNILSGIGKGIGKIMGFEKNCKNKGYKDGSGKCICPPYHFGSFCEQVNCANNGRLIQGSRSNSKKYLCQCPNPEFISGDFCQYIKCLNGGTPVNGEGRCSCNNNWYSGNFCENYSASWTIVFVIPIIILIIVTFLCAMCRLDLCPKRNATIHENNINSRRRRRGRGNTSYPTNIVARLPPLDGEERERMVTEHFLNQCRMQRYVSTSNNGVSRTSIIGENVSITNDDTTKILEPPPSYIEALSATPAPPLPIDITTAPHPPAYHTIDPNRRPPS
uniref:EGF-like domain-containing protein n=1 Tax=Parastrongyloides trichosuri TaxID=131310 RepID=A0A0N4ZH53_PARTI